MNESQITALIDQRIQATSSANRFQLSAIPKHVHNGTDAPYTFQQTRIFAASVLTIGGVAHTYFPFPSGWVLTHPSTGHWVITHNLNTEQYVAIATPVAHTSAWGISVEPNPNYVNINLFTTTTGAAVDGNFNFIVVQTNNNITTPVN